MTRHPARIDSLEQRRLLSASGPLVDLDQGLLTITASDRVGMRLNLAVRDDALRLAIRGQPAIAFALSDIDRIEIIGGRRADTIIIDESDGAIDRPIFISTNAGWDFVRGDETALDVHGGAHEDTIYGSEGDDTIIGGGSNDELFGEDGNDLLRGGSNNDALFGGRGDDDLFGEAGHDLLEGDRGFDRLNGGSGNDDLVDFSWRGERNLFIGGSGSDRFFIGPHDRVADAGWRDQIFWGHLDRPWIRSGGTYVVETYEWWWFSS